MHETRPVLIVGAGPTGLTAALELARFGIPVRLVDQYTQPSATSRALAVQSRTVELMQQRGLAAEMVALGNRGFAAALYDRDRQLGKVALHQVDSRFNYVLLLAQSETERILREHVHAAGVDVETSTTLTHFTQHAGPAAGVRATLRRGDGSIETVDAAWMIDAEGAHSSARHRLDLPFEGNALPNTYAIADLYLDGDVAEDELSIFIPEAGLVAAFPMGDRRFRVLATERHAVAHDAPAPTLDDLRAAWAQSVSIPVLMRDLQWSSRFRINSRALKQLRHGSIFFAGDAAHIHSPAGGQGMNTGMHDVINLGWKMALVYRGAASAALLDTYDAERLPIIHQLVSTTERATDLFNSDSHFVHTLMRHLLPLALTIDAVKKKGAGLVSELGVHYRKSPLNGAREGNGAIEPGDRFPDVAVTDSGSARMLDLLDPSRLTILRTGSAPASLQLARYQDICVERIVAAPGVALRAALGDAAVAVVRPDGYLLCAGSAQVVQHALDAWAERWIAAEHGAA